MNKDLSLGPYSVKKNHMGSQMSKPLAVHNLDRFSYFGSTWVDGCQTMVQMIYADPEGSDYGLFVHGSKLFIVADEAKVEVEDIAVISQMIKMLKRVYDDKVSEKEEL